MQKKIAVVLSGCGFLDGAEIHESVLTMLHVTKSGAALHCFAPDIKQTTVTSHLTRDSLGESRSVLAESARIARCDIGDLKKLDAKDFDAVIFPGGFGAALNLCNFGTKGADCTVHPEVERVINAFHQAKKPIGAICIAPAIVARVLGNKGVELTIGTDPGTAQTLEKLGARHVNKKVTEIHYDEKNRVATTPAYMLAQNIAEVDAGVSRLVAKIIEVC
ncbi:MAG: isoprenoid biosynthesis glyoxalase ElbB [Deltaproteobacteria bacterium]|nr:isoprenoid biosynthesis glyoxalase ElbB [Deltaproteobacteria bacterium]